MRIGLKLFFLLIFAGIMTSCSLRESGGDINTNYTEYVNPFIGTDGHGHTFPGAALPFSMVQLSPDTHNEGWDWCSGYHYSDSSVMGFSHTHLSGTGRGDLMDILFMPTVGDEIFLTPGSRENPDSGYRSRFSHDQEQAEPGYYSVSLLDYDIDVDLTITRRAGFHRYKSNRDSVINLIIDLDHGRADDTTLTTRLIWVNDSTVAGMRESKGWGEPGEEHFIQHKVYFFAEFSHPVQDIIVDGGTQIDENTWGGDSITSALSFNLKDDSVLLAKVGISPVDIEGAKRNLGAEIPHWDFSKTKNEAKAVWEENLSLFHVSDHNTDNKETFYTALYHAFLAPYLYMDVDNRYPGMDGDIHEAIGFTNYTLFSLWDTFRALHPLLTITHPELVNDFINSMLAHYDQYGLLPEWSLATSETFTMIGYHAVPVILDAYQKGIDGFNKRKAFTAMKQSANSDIWGRNYYREYGYVPYDKADKSVSKTLEYAFDDWCIMKMAELMESPKDIEKFRQRSMSYKNLFDEEINFMRGKNAEGQWREDFDPFFATHDYYDFIEGNAWQYTWFVPHDISGLISLFDGEKAFNAKLDSLFTVDSKLSGYDIPPDISGLIGQYAHGNEPSHHIAYLFNYSGEPEKTRKYVSHIRDRFYNNTPNGICGNEDCGQLSAWYIFSALGFYPVNPVSGAYDLGVPLFNEVSIDIPNGNTFTVRANDKNGGKWTLNKEEINDYQINHQDITEGGLLEFH
ncbi:MAG: GH92 family glycosyl hydrolase [bacterium]